MAFVVVVVLLIEIDFEVVFEIVVVVFVVVVVVEFFVETTKFAVVERADFDQSILVFVVVFFVFVVVVAAAGLLGVAVVVFVMIGFVVAFVSSKNLELSGRIGLCSCLCLFRLFWFCNGDFETKSSPLGFIKQNNYRDELLITNNKNTTVNFF